MFLPLCSIINNDEGYGLINNLKLEVSIPPYSTVYKNAILYMRKDFPQLPDTIKELNRKALKHNTKINELSELINSIINTSFKKLSLSPISSEENYFKIEKDIIKEISLESWKRIIDNISPSSLNIETINKKIEEDIDKNIRFRKELNSFKLIKIPDKTIGYGNSEIDLNHIEEIFKNKVLKNEHVLQNLLNIKENKFSLEKDVIQIQVISSRISSNITNEVYDTNAKCCPTFWGLFRKYFFTF